jgi:hypothetical protein
MADITDTLVQPQTFKGGFVLTFEKNGPEKTIRILLDRLLDNGFYVEGMTATCSLEEIEFTSYGAILKNPNTFFHSEYLEKVTTRDGTILWSKQ